MSWEKVEMVSMGVRVRWTDSLNAFLVRTFREVEGEKEWVIKARKSDRRMTGRAGTLYRVEVNREEGQLKVGGAEVIGVWEDEDDRRRWSILEDTAKAEFDGDQRRREIEKEVAWKEGLDPIRRAYGEAVGVNRQRIVAAVVEYICRG